MNFANQVDAAARDQTSEAGVSDPRRSLTFAELASETNAFADALDGLGVDPGDRVALYLPNSVDFVVAYFGAMKRGAVPFPVNMRFEPPEIEYVLGDAEARVLVTAGTFEDAVADLDLASLDHLVVVDGERGTDFHSLVAEGADEYDVHPRKEDELAELVYTSGTTGRPKGVRHTHRNLSANARGMVRYMRWSTHETALTVCPCFHVSGLNITVTPFVQAGAPNHLLPEWDPGGTLSAVEEHGVTYAFFIPTMVIDLLQHGADGHDVSSLETIGVGGSPMPKERIEAVEAEFGVTLYEGYGMTETTPLAAINRPGQELRKAGSIGPPASEVVDVRIEVPESGEEADVGEQGELLWHGDTVTPGYFRMPEKNEEAFVRREGKRWLRSGDVGRMDEDGHLYVEDRIDDMIITGGENVYPREVEDVLFELEAVQGAAVVGTHHDRLGEQVTAIVVADGLSAEKLETHARDRLTDYKAPRRVEFVDELPKTSTRKVDKVALRDRYG